jgi:hypothetical protein
MNLIGIALLLALDGVLATLAAGVVVDYWRNGSIFEDHRAAVEAAADNGRISGRRDRIAEMLACSFCLTFWAAVWAAVFTVLGTACIIAAPIMPAGNNQVIMYGLGTGFYLPVVAMAAARASWLINGLLPPHLRYDRDAALGAEFSPLPDAPARPEARQDQPKQDFDLAAETAACNAAWKLRQQAKDKA